MKFADLQKEFDRVKGLLESGTVKLGKKDYEGACTDFEECLEILEKGHPPDHPDRIACLKGLGDTYFALHRYGEARQIFKELLKISETYSGETYSGSDVDPLVTRFKLAKSAERAGQPKEALAIYEILTALAEESHVNGQPFFSTILESHADLLSRVGSKKKSQALSNKARSNRNKYSKKDTLSTTVLSGLSREEDEEASTGDGSKGVLDNSEISMYSSETARTLKDRKQWMQASEGRPTWRLVALGVTTIVCLGAIGGALFCVQHFSKSKGTSAATGIGGAPKTSEVFQSRHYASLDGQESLELIDRVTAKLTISGASQTVGWSRVGSVLASIHKADSLVFADHGGVLTDGNGLKLYSDGAPELKVVRNMRALVAVANKAYTLDNKYPEEIERVSTVGQGMFLQNPVNSNSLPIKIVYLGHDKQWNPDSTGVEPAVLAQLRQTAPTAFGDNLIEGCVYGYYLLSGNADTGLSVKAFFVRGCDRKGQFLQSSQRGTNLIFCGLNGREIEKTAAVEATGPNSLQQGQKPFVIIDNTITK